MNEMSPEIVAKTIRAYFDAISDLNAEAWLNTFAEDAESYDPADALPSRGHEELRRFFQNIAGALKQLTMTPEHVFIVGNQAAVKWTGRGVGNNGRSIHFEGIDLIEINEDGKIQTVRAYWNPLELMSQLK